VTEDQEPSEDLTVAHPLVEQLRFTRGEWLRALKGVPAADGIRRLEPMNSISWIVGHLAWHEQRYWLTRLHGETPVPVLNELVASGGPPSTPALRSMLTAWRTVTRASDPHLDALTSRDLLDDLPAGPPRQIGTALRRVTYHYWFHIGEILAIRQLLGHPHRPEFVGNIDGLAPYRPEPGA
jgi:hypothetical protein